MLMAFLGPLGAGKTLALTYIGSIWYKRGYAIYSNYKLSFPFKPIIEFEDIEDMSRGYAMLDELWLWLDARMAITHKNRAISEILLKSRKRDVSIGYTAQSFRQIDVRLRHITDYLAMPELRRNKRWCILKVYQNPPGRKPLFTRRFRTAPFFKMYDTREEIKQVGYEEHGT